MHQPRTRRSIHRLVLALGLGSLPVVRARPAAAAAAGIVSALRGRVEAVRDGAVRPLHVGAAVDVRDSLRTMAGARLLLTLADGSTLAMGEESQVVLTEVMGGDDSGMVFDLLAGIVRAVLGPSPPDIFAVRGRAAVAAARSTDFIVETTSVKTSVFVADGVVAVDEVYGRGETTLDQGQGIDVVRGQPFATPKSWGQGRVDQVLARTDAGD